jgi:hypothetical protein
VDKTAMKVKPGIYDALRRESKKELSEADLVDFLVDRFGLSRSEAGHAVAKFSYESFHRLKRKSKKNPIKINFKIAKNLLAPHGLTIRSTGGGEYRVNFKGGDEETAYYTNDLKDAVDTGIIMAKQRRRNNPRKKYAESAKLRDKLTPEEISYFRHLKTIKDPAKLARLVPAWARAASPPARRQFVPGQPPQYPAWTAAKAMRLHPEDMKFPTPREGMTMQEYIKEFDRLNGLKSNPRRKKKARAARPKRRANPRIKTYVVQTWDGKRWIDRNSWKTDKYPNTAYTLASGGATVYAKIDRVKARVIVK